MWEARNVLNSLLWEAAVESLGIYPRAIIRDGVETKRTEWQDGWNAAVMDITERHEKFTAWAGKLTDEQKTLLRELMDHDAEPIFLRLDGDEIKLFIHCGDTFAYACADAEDFTLENLPEIARLWKEHGYLGPVAWIARKRHAEPVKEWRFDRRYLAAKADLIPIAEHAKQP